MTQPDRTILPLADEPAPTTRVVDVRDTQIGTIDQATAPEGAPNVVIVLLDDMGFGASSAFGGPCEMPTAERLSDDGLRYTRFPTPAL